MAMASYTSKLFILGLVSAAIVLLSVVSFGQKEGLLNRVPELQRVALRSGGGAMGCGTGTITLVTAKGDINVETSLDPIHVFGKRIVVDDLVMLLKARVESNKTGIDNPMLGSVGQLVFVIVGVLQSSKDPSIVPLIAELLDDEDDVIRGASAISLIRLGNNSDEMMKLIEQKPFPKPAVDSARARGIDLPEWVRIKS